MEQLPHAPEPDQHSPRHAAEAETQAARIDRYVAALGNAFLAFLTLPDSDPEDPELFADFDDNYVGTYPHDQQTVLENVTEYASVRDQIRRTASEAGWPEETVKIDVGRLWHLTQDLLFDIVDYEGEYHIFTK